MLVGKVVDGCVWEVCCMSWSTPAGVWGYCGWVMFLMGVVLGIFGAGYGALACVLRGDCSTRLPLPGLSVHNPCTCVNLAILPFL